MMELDWYGCYKANWNIAPLVPEAYAHPAKVAYGLAERIYTHLLERGYICPGDKVADPFGGIAGFAFHAMRYGLHWEGCELEPKFVDLGNQNIDLWNVRYAGWFANWGTARLVQGDSRELCKVLGGGAMVISSPPYANAINAHGEGPGMAGNEAQRKRIYEGNQNEQAAKSRMIGYGSSPGQLGAMREGTPPAAFLSSPPYADVINGNGEGTGTRYDHKTHKGDNATKRSSQTAYGDGETYGDHPANIGNDQGESFWSAAAVIVEQCYQLLPPGGMAAWVCGDFVRDKQRVYFGRQWLAMCESAGLEGVEWIRAWKYEDNGTQLGLFGNDVDKRVERVSFFRRLANQKAIEDGREDAAILNEDVIIVRKP